MDGTLGELICWRFRWRRHRQVRLPGGSGHCRLFCYSDQPDPKRSLRISVFDHNLTFGAIKGLDIFSPECSVNKTLWFDLIKIFLSQNWYVKAIGKKNLWVTFRHFHLFYYFVRFTWGRDHYILGRLSKHYPPFLMRLVTKSIFSALYKWFNFDIIEK